MSDDKDPKEAFEQASSKLNEGLKSCRSVVDKFRAMLGAQAADADSPDQPEAPAGSPTAPDE